MRAEGLKAMAGEAVQVELLGSYSPQLHLSHFLYSREVGRPCGGRGVLVYNDYRQLMRRSFRTN